MFLESIHVIFFSLGPVSRSPEVLVQMIETGMNIARLNFSHGSHEYHAETIVNIRKAAEEYSKKIGMTYPLAIALDTKGPEIRTGLLEGVRLDSQSFDCAGVVSNINVSIYTYYRYLPLLSGIQSV